MRKIYEVAQREFMETIRTRTFLLSLVLMPVFIVGLAFLSQWLLPRSDTPRPPVRVRVAGSAPELSARIEATLTAHNQSHPLAPITFDLVQANEPVAAEQGKNDLRAGQLDAFVMMEGDLGGKGGTVRIFTYRPKPSQVEALGTVERLLREAVIDRRYETLGLDRKVLQGIWDIPVQWTELGQAQGQERQQGLGQRRAQMLVPFAFMYLIFLGIVGMGQHLISSIIEEKNSRIIEVLLSAVSPFELMAGKIAGLATAGLGVMAVWAMTAFAAARWRGLPVDVNAELLVCGLIYYILGFVLFSAILAGVGSVCNTIKETQGLLMPVMLVFILPLLAWPRLAHEPNGELARVLSYVPPITPMVMILRLSAGTDVWVGEVFLSIVALSMGVLIAVWAAAKVFRTGILMYGKRPSLREISHWLRAR